MEGSSGIQGIFSGEASTLTEFEVDIRLEVESSVMFPTAVLKFLRDRSPAMRVAYLSAAAEYMGLWAAFGPKDPVGSDSLNIRENVDRLYRRALELSNGNNASAARMLGVDSKTLYNWRRKEGLV